MKKERYWICYKCAEIYSRKKKDIYCSCYYCGKNMVAGRKYPGDWFWQKRTRLQAKRRKAKAQRLKRDSRIYDSHGYVLYATKEAKKLWRRIEQSKSLSTLKTQGAKLISEVHSNMIHTRGVNGMTHPPDLIVEKTKSTVKHGQYRKGILFGQYAISVFQHRPMNLKEMKATFLHELLHHIDSESHYRNNKKCNHMYHDRTWKSRLKKLKILLGVKDEAILNAD